MTAALPPEQGTIQPLPYHLVKAHPVAEEVETSPVLMKGLLTADMQTCAAVGKAYYIALIAVDHLLSSEEAVSSLYELLVPEQLGQLGCKQPVEEHSSLQYCQEMCRQ